MEQPEKKDNIRALAGSIVFHAILLALFLFLGLRTPLPLPEEHGVLISLGYMDEGMGTAQPLMASPPVPDSRPSQPSSIQEEVVTQQSQEAISLPAEAPRREPERPRPESPRRDPVPPAETSVQPPPETPRQQVDPRAIFPGADQRSTARTEQGQATATGSQGRPEGAIDGEGMQGAGQGGVEFSLTGRRANALPLPEYRSQSTGRVVVTIIVNRQGQVIRATAGARGTTISDQTLWRLAEEAARRSRFDVQANAPEEQSGTITYLFLRLQ